MFLFFLFNEKIMPFMIYSINGFLLKNVKMPWMYTLVKCAAHAYAPDLDCLSLVIAEYSLSRVSNHSPLC
jgi:hypothetical protein